MRDQRLLLLLLLELEFDDELLEELLDELEELLLEEFELEFELELELELLLLLELEFDELLRELFEELLDELLLLRLDSLRPTARAARLMPFSQPRKKPCTAVSPRGLLRELFELEFELEFELLLELLFELLLDELLLARAVTLLAAIRPATVVAIMRCRVCCFIGAPVQGGTDRRRRRGVRACTHNVSRWQRIPPHPVRTSNRRPAPARQTGTV